LLPIFGFFAGKAKLFQYAASNFAHNAAVVNN
jgi:hypothetical protein